MKKSIITLTILVCTVLSISAQQTAPTAAGRTASPAREVKSDEIIANKVVPSGEMKTDAPKACCAGKTAAECKHDGKTCTKSEVKACCADKAAGQCSHDAHASGKTETKACCASGNKKTCNHDKPEEKKKD